MRCDSGHAIPASRPSRSSRSPSASAPAPRLSSQINAVFWKTLPVSRPSELRLVAWTSPRPSFVGLPNVFAGPKIGDTATFGTFSYPAYVAMRDGSRAFSDLACWADIGEARPVVLGDAGYGAVQFVSGNYFQTLGVPAIARTDDSAGRRCERILVAGCDDRPCVLDPRVRAARRCDTTDAGAERSSVCHRRRDAGRVLRNGRVGVAGRGRPHNRRASGCRDNQPAGQPTPLERLPYLRPAGAGRHG